MTTPLIYMHGNTRGPVDGTRMVMLYQACTRQRCEIAPVVLTAAGDHARFLGFRDADETLHTVPGLKGRLPDPRDVLAVFRERNGLYVDGTGGLNYATLQPLVQQCDDHAISIPAYTYGPLTPTFAFPDTTPFDAQFRTEYPNHHAIYRQALDATLAPVAEALQSLTFDKMIVYAHSMGASVLSTLLDSATHPLMPYVQAGVDVHLVLDSGALANVLPQQGRVQSDHLHIHVMRSQQDDVVPPLNTTAVALAARRAGHRYVHTLSGPWGHDNFKDEHHRTRLFQHFDDILTGTDYTCHPDVFGDPFEDLTPLQMEKAAGVFYS